MSSPSSDPLSQSLTGQVVVFTGKLSSLGRKDARALVERLGGVTSDEVTTQTTLLVVGEEAVPGGADKTQPVRRAEELNQAQGNAIKILSEGEFCELAGVPSPEVSRLCVRMNTGTGLSACSCDSSLVPFGV